MNTASTPTVSPELAALVRDVVRRAPVVDIHTHLYDPTLSGLLLWGIDELLVYHYLVAEVFRWLSLPYEELWRLPKSRQAELIWDALFVQRSPISEACRGVITTLNRLGLDARRQDLPALRKWFAAWKPADYVTRCLELAGVRQIYMTNSPFDDEERPTWLKGFARDERFVGALRIDPLLLDWPNAVGRLREWGYDVTPELSDKSSGEAQRFLRDWIARLQARYLIVSLPPTFAFPSAESPARLLAGVVLPVCREAGLPMALMLGVTRAVNPQLRLAGDGVGCSDLTALASLCAAFPENKFLVTVLARENQHELCVLARKFRNLHPFGCWWFTNVPSLIGEITRLRVELLGLSFTPQHSDARVLDQLIYKWDHSRAVIGDVLAEHYGRLAQTGWTPTTVEVERDVGLLFGGAFESFCSE